MGNYKNLNVWKISIAFEIDYLLKEDFIKIETATDNISKMLISLIKSKK